MHKSNDDSVLPDATNPSGPDAIVTDVNSFIDHEITPTPSISTAVSLMQTDPSNLIVDFNGSEVIPMYRFNMLSILRGLSPAQANTFWSMQDSTVGIHIYDSCRLKTIPAEEAATDIRNFFQTFLESDDVDTSAPQLLKDANFSDSFMFLLFNLTTYQCESVINQ
jgi:hypothetical protein